MPELESILEQLASEFPASDMQGIDIYMHFTPESCKAVQVDKLIRTCRRIQKRFRGAFNRDLRYHFDVITSSPPNSMGILFKEMTQSFQKEPVNMVVNAMSAYSALIAYSFLGPLSQLLMDYTLFLRNNSQQEGLHCVLHEIQDHSLDGKTLGVAVTGQPYMLTSISRCGSARIMLHEISHCLGARHSYFPFSYMYPRAKSVFGNSFYWDPFSKRAIKKELRRAEQ